MTNAIGTGTKNFTLNLPADVLAFIGRLAGPGNVGKFMKGLLADGLEKHDPVAARRLNEMLRSYYGVFFAMLTLWLSFQPDVQMRRPSSSVRPSARREVTA